MFFSIFLISIFVLISVALLISLFTTIKIDVKEAVISNVVNSNTIRENEDNNSIKRKVNKRKTDEISKNIEYNYLVYIKFYLFNFIKFFQIKVDKEKFEQSKIFKKFEMKKINKNYGDVKIGMHNLHPCTEMFNLTLKIGTESIILTTGVVFLLGLIISYILQTTIKKVDENKHYYKIEPLYMEKNQISMKLKCIISIKMVHIINIIYIILKKRRGAENERTSNRRVNANSYE